MKPYIAINASSLCKDKKTGVEWYTWQLLKYLAREWKQSDPTIVLFAPQKTNHITKSLSKNWRIKILPSKFLWTQYYLANFLKRYPPALLFSPSYVAPRFLPKAIPTINVVHGLEGERFPEFSTLKQITLDKLLIIPALKHSTRIIAVSEHTRKDLNHYYNIPLAKIQTVLSGPGTLDDMETKSVETQNFASLQIKNNKCINFLFLDGSNERKNSELALRIYFALKKQIKNIRLTITGSIGKNNPKIESIIKDENIVLLGYLSEAEKKKQLEAAHFLLYPSFYEGFGFPVLEAQAFGAVPIVLKGSGLSEVGADGIIEYDCQDEKKSIALIADLIKDPKKYSQLQKKGLKNMQRFSWQSCAQEIREIIVNSL